MLNGFVTIARNLDTSRLIVLTLKKRERAPEKMIIRKMIVHTERKMRTDPKAKLSSHITNQKKQGDYVAILRKESLRRTRSKKILFT